MKKIISIFMIFLLSFSTVGPFPVFAKEKTFPGTVLVSLDNKENIGTISVKMNDDFEWTLMLTKDYDGNQQHSHSSGRDVTFTEVPAGSYTLIAKGTKEPDIKITHTLAQIKVKPGALSVGSEEANIHSTAKVPNQLTVTSAEGANEIKLYINGSDQKPRKANVDSEGSAVFSDIEARSTYRLAQVINEAESEKSMQVTVIPKDVKIERTKDSGPTNDAGEILVMGTKKDNILILYRGGKEFKTAVSETTTFTFDNLPEGTYKVEQTENGVSSDKESNEVIILNEQKPFIDLNGEKNLDLYYTIDEDDDVTKMIYTELGYKVTDKNQRVYSGDTTKYFCKDLGSVKEQDGAENCELLMKVEIDSSQIKNNSDEDSNPKKYTPPGKYKVFYTATDGNNKNLISTETRNVTVYPNAVNLKGINTKETHLDAPIQEHINGEITVKGVYPNATLKLYQDQSNSNDIENATLISSNPKVNDHVFSFPKVPVGSGYFVVQEFNDVQSLTSKRIDILDTTKPELAINGESEITLEVGDRYIEHGATAMDNMDTEIELTSRIQINGTVNTNIPGEYKITYTVKDKAGNEAIKKQRTVYVQPSSLISIGSTALTGEIGVNNIFPGLDNRPTTLTLYKADSDGKFNSVNSQELKNKEMTYVFKPYGPGRYYVTQTVNKQESTQSNIVEIVDIDRPYLTLDGPDKIKLVWDEDQSPYYKKTDQQLTDPGATANDYLEANKLILTATMLTPSGDIIKNNPETIEGQKISFKPDTQLTEPGTYKITYTAEAPRGNSEANPKHRIITLAPPKTLAPKSVAGESTITIKDDGDEKGVFSHSTTVVKLYNAYSQLIDSEEVKDSTNATFKRVPAGLGYYVTQTVNGIESAPSTPVNVSIHADADKSAFSMTSFGFTSLKATGVIDQASGNITVTVPKGTNLKKLKASFNVKKPDNIPTSINVNNKLQRSGSTEQDFTKPVKYSVTATIDNKAVVKNYTVTVIHAHNSSDVWKESVNKNISITTGTQSITMTPAEKAIAIKKGISFMTSDAAIHVSAVNVRESRNATLTVKSPNGVVTTKDPAWSKKATNIIEIGWGGETQSFLQPIEVEMPNPTNKVFVKLVRGEDDKLSAVVQPSETAGKNILGLASEPGTYALIEDIGRPVILPRVQNGKTVYTLATGNKDATIYYTTNSSDVRFDRSARDRTLSSYMFDGVPSDLTTWKKYTGGNISTPTGELYAVIVHNQVISPVRAIDLEPATQWQDKDIPTVERHKIWNVKFNARVNKKELYANAIYVTDDATKKVVETTLQLSPDGKTISVIPTTMYDANKQYTLWIDKEMKGNTVNKEFLNKPTKITFTAK